MNTLEQAIVEIEDLVSTRYRENFPESQLRKNTADNIEFLKFNFETIKNAKKNDVKLKALENILNIVLDDHLLPKSWQKEGEKNYFDYCRNQGIEHRLIKYPHDIERCVGYCNDIITRLDEDNKDEDSLSVSELNKKYEKKWLYFNGDESGCQWIYVENIHRDKDTPVLCVDGVMVDYDGQASTFKIHGIENKNFSDFYYFDWEGEDDEDYDGYVFCSSLDKALMSSPCDTNLESHVISSKDVVDDILNLFAWEFENGYDVHVPGMAKLFESLKYDKD